jgi:hypothetical protein
MIHTFPYQNLNIRPSPFNQIYRTNIDLIATDKGEISKSFCLLSLLLLLDLLFIFTTEQGIPPGNITYVHIIIELQIFV